MRRSPVTVYCLLITALLLLIGCTNTAPPPTLVPLADTPVIAATGETAVVAQPAGSSDTAVLPAETPTPGPPTPDGIGLRPQDAQQLWVPDAGPNAPAGDRPPPMKVPLSLHPDDHYWFIRPIPSGSRNFDLEWYPFGNDVLRPDIGPYRIHHGLDFPNDTGTPVLAAADGVVVHAGALPSPRNGVNYYGNTVVILHDWQWQGKDIYTLYAHTLELFVTEGDRVQQGQLVAGVGSSGEVSGPHLHFEVRVGSNTYGDTRNPTLWLAPFEGHGTIAGRFVDKNGRFITGAEVQIRSADRRFARTQRTYWTGVASDDVWRENFVFGDLPAGAYEVLVTDQDGNQYIREVDVRAGLTSFTVISTNSEFIPTATPPPSPTPTDTPEATAVSDEADADSDG